MSAYVFAGGGTGGHLYPSLAIIRALRESDPAARIKFFCTDRPIDAQVLGRAGVEAVPQRVRPFRTKPWHWPGFLMAWRGAIAECICRFRTNRPAVVVGAGGYGSDPPVRAALALGIPTAILNPDLVPGRANVRLGAKVDRVYAQWNASAKYFPLATGFRAHGCPIRPDFAQARREDGIALFKLDPNRRTLLVTGASQGARTINDAFINLAPDLAALADWQVLHLSGVADADRVRAAYASAGVPATVLDYTENMPEAMAAADLAVSRAGASTLAELTVVGLPSVLLPYPYHKDQHQRKNAEALADEGAARIVTDVIDAAANTAAIRQELLPLLSDAAELARMKDAAQGLGRPNAAARIASELMVLATEHRGNAA